MVVPPLDNTAGFHGRSSEGEMETFDGAGALVTKKKRSERRKKELPFVFPFRLFVAFFTNADCRVAEWSAPSSRARAS